MSEKADGGLTFEECKESLDTFSAWKSPGTVLEKMAFRWMARVLCNFFWSYWEWLKVVFHLRRKTFVVNNFFSILLLITCYRLAFFVIDNFLWSTTICLVRRGPLLSQELSYSTSLSDFTDEELETSCRQLKNQEQELVVIEIVLRASTDWRISPGQLNWVDNCRQSPELFRTVETGVINDNKYLREISVASVCCRRQKACFDDTLLP